VLRDPEEVTEPEPKVAVGWNSRHSAASKVQGRISSKYLTYNGLKPTPDVRASRHWGRLPARPSPPLIRVSLEQEITMARTSIGLVIACAGLALAAAAPPQVDIPALEAKAAKGNAYAMQNLGDSYYFAQGVEQNFDAALRWYRAAVAKGNAVAMERLGQMAEGGSGGPQDYAEAFRWFQAAAKAGDAQAMLELGQAYDSGMGVAEDSVAAVRWFRASAALGNKIAMESLAICYKYGSGVPKNDALAVRWLRKAAALGSYSAKKDLRERGLKP
jgi:TPR repeat protein